MSPADKLKPKRAIIHVTSWSISNIVLSFVSKRTSEQKGDVREQAF